MDSSGSIWLATAMEQSIAFMSRPFGALFIDLQTTLTTEITWRGHLWTCILHHFGGAFGIIDCRYLAYPLPSMLIWCREYENNCPPHSSLPTQQHKFKHDVVFWDLNVFYIKLSYTRLFLDLMVQLKFTSNVVKKVVDILKTWNPMLKGYISAHSPF